MKERDNSGFGENEHNIPLSKKAVSSIAATINKEPQAVEEIIRGMLELDSDINKAEIYRLLVNGKGAGKNHFSSYQDGDIKPGRKAGLSRVKKYRMRDNFLKNSSD